jgi:hypothetical protein
MQSTGRLATYYWMGLEFNTTVQSWIWQDGGNAGNGAVSNSNPYAHFAYDFQDIRTNNPTWTCVAGYYYRRYDQVRTSSRMPRKDVTHHTAMYRGHDQVPTDCYCYKNTHIRSNNPAKRIQSAPGTRRHG